MYKKIILSSVFVCFLPLLASADAVLRSGETVSVAADQVVNGDFYAGGGTVSLSGQVQGDVHAAAGSLTNNGTVNGDLTVAAGSAQIHASVTDDVRVIGGEVVIAGSVSGDVVVFGGLLKILSTAEVGGDIIFFGGDLQVLGPVNGSVMGTAENVRIDTSVAGSVDVTTTRLTLGDRAEVVGDIRYVSNNEIVRSQNAVVVGEVTQNSAPLETEVSYEGVVISFIVILFTALIFQLLFRAQLTRHMPELLSAPGIAGLIGIAVLILAPILVVMLMASMLGLLAGLVLLALFILLIFVSFAVMSIMIGSLISKYAQGTTTPNVLYTIGGALVVQVMLLVPLIGHTLAIVVFFVVFGALCRRFFLAFRS